MALEEDKRLRISFAEVLDIADVTAGNEGCAEAEHEALERKIFGLALAIATEPSKLAQVRQMLVQLQEQRDLPEEFSTWALRQIDERVTSMALEYAHNAELLLQILSFKGGTLKDLIQTIEDLYQREQISQRVYVAAKLMLRAAGHW